MRRISEYQSRSPSGWSAKSAGPNQLTALPLSKAENQALLRTESSETMSAELV